MATLPDPGTFRLYPYAKPPLAAGSYTLTGEVGGLPGAVEAMQAAIDVTAPRYALPPDQVLSTFPPASARGAFTTRLPQVVLRRRTLPWERSEFAAGGGPLDDTATPRPWLALVLIADGEGSLFSDVPVGESVTSPVKLAGDADVAKTTCLEVPEGVVAKVFPALEDLPMLCHVREVDLADTELALGDDDGWMAVVLCNRLPQPDTRYTACLINLEGQYDKLPVNPPVAEEYSKTSRVVDFAKLQQVISGHLSGDAAGMKLPRNVLGTELVTGGSPGRAAPAAGAGWAPTPADRGVTASDISLVYKPVSDLRVIGRGIGFVVPWHLFERTLRFPVLASWSFQCTERGDFESLAKNVNSRLLGHVASELESPDGQDLSEEAKRELEAQRELEEPASVRPLPLISATGHVATAHETRRGETTTAWFRGPLVPEPVARAGPRPDGRYPLAHHADQLRRVTPDGQEDLTYAAAFEIGRLLALSRPSVVAALNRWRQQGFAAVTAGAVAAQISRAAPRELRKLLQLPDPFIDGRIAVDGLPGPPLPKDGRRGIGAGRRFARGLLAALGDRPSDLADARPLADPGFPVDAGVSFAKDRDGRLAAGLALGDVLGRDPAGQAEALWVAPVAVTRRDSAADVAAARLELEDAAGELAAAAELLAIRLREGGPG